MSFETYAARQLPSLLNQIDSLSADRESDVHARSWLGVDDEQTKPLQISHLVRSHLGYAADVLAALTKVLGPVEGVHTSYHWSASG